MNIQTFNAAKTAYQSGDWASAVSALEQVKDQGEVNGEVDHLLGNALMKLGKYEQAASAYQSALSDASYGHVGALNCNCGRALVAAGSTDEAMSCFQAALADPTYNGAYKANLALGNLYSRKGMAREAGLAWRAAAIDEANPDPSGALAKLGGCFMTLGRPVDAIEAYRTALDFSNESGQGAIYGDLGLAYMASNRIAEAADAFGRAAADPNYQLTSEQQSAYTAAQKAMYSVAGVTPSDTDQMLANAGYGDGPMGNSASFDPLDPMGKSGEFMPSPEDTGFFSVTEEDLMQADKDNRKARRKHNHRGLKVFLFILLLLIILGGAGGYAYWQGYGWPTQEAVVTDMFNAAAQGSDISGYLSESVSDDVKREIDDILPAASTVEISGVDRTMTSSKVLAKATLSNGGTQDYEISLVRSQLSWKVTGVELSFASRETSNVASSADASATDTASTEATSEAAAESAEASTEAAAESAEASTEASTEATE